METVNTILGIIASMLSIAAIVFSRKTSNRTKEIEKMISQKFDIHTGTKKEEKNTYKKAVSGNNGNSIIGDNNKVSGDK
ncbi:MULTISPECIES: hypothetical protein [Enterococcus]|uniref:Uncharacterized protein n=1 Tax=Enterococcus dongliensis TaxID=2559925 RepID=A0AAW8TEW4_9ENTE|nr:MULTISPECIES: hypothetical protein [Enterococcus]MDT2387912.1 hypothetical protein [Enterococcus avium]MDT2636583.1 hypothetical protein [Enterococcus dongliensis]